MEEKNLLFGSHLFPRQGEGSMQKAGDFAALLGMNASTISGAMQVKDKYLTENFMSRVRTCAQQVGLEEGAEPQRPAAPNIVSQAVP